MQNNSNGVSTGLALLLTIGLIISLFEPRCSMYGCDDTVSEGKRYCFLSKTSQK